jgi:hypothetical protein
MFVIICLAAGCGGGTAAQNHRLVSSSCGPSGATDDCMKDADCPNNGVCSCAGNTFGFAKSTKNSCVPANCHVDGDCGAAGFCSPTTSPDCGSFYGVQGYYCHTPADSCTNDGDCPKQGQTSGHCSYAPEVGHWACYYGWCAG